MVYVVNVLKKERHLKILNNLVVNIVMNFQIKKEDVNHVLMKMVIILIILKYLKIVLKHVMKILINMVYVVLVLKMEVNLLI